MLNGFSITYVRSIIPKNKKNENGARNVMKIIVKIVTFVGKSGKDLFPVLVILPIGLMLRFMGGYSDGTKKIRKSTNKNMGHRPIFFVHGYPTNH